MDGWVHTRCYREIDAWMMMMREKTTLWTLITFDYDDDGSSSSPPWNDDE